MLEERFSVNVQKKLKREHHDNVMKLVELVDSLRVNPIKKNSLRCKEPGYSETIFTISCLDYRILYEVDFNENVIIIQDIEKETQDFVKS